MKYEVRVKTVEYRTAEFTSEEMMEALAEDHEIAEASNGDPSALTHEQVERLLEYNVLHNVMFNEFESALEPVGSESVIEFSEVGQ